jgi:hypothetical protein
MLWIMYDANGHMKKTDLSCRERFTRVSALDFWQGIGKVFVQPALMRSMMIHNGFPVEGFHIVDELKSNFDEAAMQKLDATSDLICVDHYYTKSHDEWLEKMKRGSADPNYSRKYGEFFYFNPDLKVKEAYEETVPEQEYDISKKIAPQRIVIRNMYNGE